jgi:hypothetical protein
MPLNPRRVQAVFLEAADYHDPADRAAILDRECSADLELRRRVEALLKAHDEFNRFLNDPVVVTVNTARRDRGWRAGGTSGRSPAPTRSRRQQRRGEDEGRALS